MATFPDILCIQMLTFTLGENWVPKKLNVAIQLDPQSQANGSPRPEWRLNLSALRALGGLQVGETLMHGKQKWGKMEPLKCPGEI